MLVVFRRFHALALLIGQRCCLINVKDFIGFEALIETTLEKQVARASVSSTFGQRARHQTQTRAKDHGLNCIHSDTSSQYVCVPVGFVRRMSRLEDPPPGGERHCALEGGHAETPAK